MRLCGGEGGRGDARRREAGLRRGSGGGTCAAGGAGGVVAYLIGTLVLL
jgi:hypothetical protein